MQSFENIWKDKNLLEILKQGGVAVMPTDTIYGIVGKGEFHETVERIYKIRNRDIQKPCIILIGDINELEKFSLELTEKQKEKLKEYWPSEAKAPEGQPESISIVLDCTDDKFEYLHRGTKTLAFRLPALETLKELLIKIGPLIAPSANIEGKLVAKSIDEAKNYFGGAIDFYADGGKVEGKASKLIKLHKDGSVSILRE